MVNTKVSSKFQIVLPKEIRKEANLKVGEELTVVVRGGIINLIPKQSAAKLKGFLKGMNTANYREDTERL